MLGEAGLAAHDARPRPRQTEARCRQRPADTPAARRSAGDGRQQDGMHRFGEIKIRAADAPGVTIDGAIDIAIGVCHTLCHGGASASLECADQRKPAASG